MMERNNLGADNQWDIEDQMAVLISEGTAKPKLPLDFLALAGTDASGLDSEFAPGYVEPTNGQEK